MPIIQRPQLAEVGRRSAPSTSKNDASLERAILALLSERSLGAAAKRAGVGERTLRRWIAEDAGFQVDLATARHATFAAGIQHVQALTARAVDALEDLLGEKTHPSVRLAAARAVLDLAASRHDAETLIHRVEELEDMQRQAKRS